MCIHLILICYIVFTVSSSNAVSEASRPPPDDIITVSDVSRPPSDDIITVLIVPVVDVDESLSNKGVVTTELLSVGDSVLVTTPELEEEGRLFWPDSGELVIETWGGKNVHV